MKLLVFNLLFEFSLAIANNKIIEKILKIFDFSIA